MFNLWCITMMHDDGEADVIAYHSKRIQLENILQKHLFGKFSVSLLFRRILLVTIRAAQHFIDHRVRQRLGEIMCQYVSRSTGHFGTVNRWVFREWFSFWVTQVQTHWFSEGTSEMMVLRIIQARLNGLTHCTGWFRRKGQCFRMWYYR
jgi:hypothetical protein